MQMSHYLSSNTFNICNAIYSVLKGKIIRERHFLKGIRLRSYEKLNVGLCGAWIFDFLENFALTDFIS